MLTFVDLIDENREFQKIFQVGNFKIFVVLLETKLVDLLESEMEARRDLLQEKSKRQKVAMQRIYFINCF